MRYGPERATDLDGVDAPVRSLLERIAGPVARPTPDLVAIGAALSELASDLDYVRPWAELLGERNGSIPIHAPERGPRLSIVHRPEDHLSPVHDHGVWVAICPVSGLERHRRYRRGALASAWPVLDEEVSLGPAEVATLLPPDDVHDHGHLAGFGSPAHVLILSGDDQALYERHEWDLEARLYRVLAPGDRGRWTAREPWP